MAKTKVEPSNMKIPSSLLPRLVATISGKAAPTRNRKADSVSSDVMYSLKVMSVRGKYYAFSEAEGRYFVGSDIVFFILSLLVPLLIFISFWKVAQIYLHQISGHFQAGFYYTCL